VCNNAKGLSKDVKEGYNTITIILMLMPIIMHCAMPKTKKGKGKAQCKKCAFTLSGNSSLEKRRGADTGRSQAPFSSNQKI
jgi:hypothetical protein